MKLYQKVLCFILLIALNVGNITSVFAKSQLQEEFVSSEQRFWKMEVDEKRDLIYVSDGNVGNPVGIKIVDIKNPANIKCVSTIKTDELVRNIAVYKNYLYSVVVDKSRIDIINTADIQNSEIVGRMSVNGAEGVVAFGKQLYVYKKGEIYAYNLDKPTEPVQTGNISGVGNILNVTADNSYCYAASTSGKLLVLDAATLEKAAEVSVTDMSYPGGILRYKDQLYISQPMKDKPRIWQYNVSDPTKPVFIKQYNDVGSVTNMAIKDDILYAVSSPALFEQFAVADDGTLTKEFSTEIAGGGVGVYIKDKYEIVTTGSNVWVYDSSFELTADMLPPIPTEDDIKESDFQCLFEDISDSYARSDIIRLNELGILSGIDSAHFSPSDKVTLAQNVAALVKTFNYPLKRYKHQFSDIDEKSWYADIFQTAIEKGFLTSEIVKEDKAEPTRNITISELAQMVMCIYITESKTKEYQDGYNALDAAMDLGFISRDETKNSEDYKVTREDMAYAVNQLRAALKGEAVFLDQDKYPIEKNRKVEFTKFLENDPESAGADGNFNIPPTILQITDAVKPGELFNIYGEGFDSKSEVYVEPAVDSDIVSAPSNAVQCSIHEIDDEGQYIATQLPKDLKPGAYKVWVSNSYGFSRAYILNKVRVQWIDRTETAYDIPFRVLGMNMCGAEFDAEMASGVSLVNGDKAYDLNIVSVNPYCIEASVPENVPAGTYKLAASNDGIIWDKSGDIEEITVVGEVYDPLNLGMAWANRFVWDKKIDVTQAPYNINPNGQEDCTVALQSAIDDIKAQGGGIVYMPEGMYKMSTIYLPSKVAIVGDGMDKTTLIYCDRDTAHKWPMITTKDDGKTEGIVGVANLCMKTLPGESVPDMYIWFTEDWGANIDDRQQRMAKYVFVKSCRLEDPFDYADTAIAGRRGLGMVLLLDSDVLVKDNVMYGGQAVPSSNYIGSYAYYINNKSISSSGHIFSVTCRGVFENNSLEFRQDLVSSSYSQGIFCRGYGYLHNNQFRNNGETSANAGEIMCTEPYRSGTMLYGNVESCDGLNVKISLIKNNEGQEAVGYSYSEENAWNINRSAAGENYIIITEGRGLGQYRKLVAADKNNKILTIDKPWDIVPDKTSKFDVLSPSIGTIQYDNWATNTKKGCWLYGDNIDCVIAKNNLIGCEGAYARSFHWMRDNKAPQCTISYFSRLTGNKTRGFSKLGKHCGIGILAAAATQDHLTAYTAYGVDIKNNSMQGKLPVPISSRVTEAEELNGIYLVTELGGTNKNHYTLKGAIVENNTVVDMDRGITAGGGEKGLFLHNNSFENNTTPIVNERGTIKIIED